MSRSRLAANRKPGSLKWGSAFYQGSLIWLGSRFGAPYALSFTLGLLTISSALIRFISPSNTLLTVAGLLAIYWLHLRKRIDLAQSFVGLNCFLIATGKVFSQQYLIWLIPPLACIGLSVFF